jgi:hypothetical protein
MIRNKTKVAAAPKKAAAPKAEKAAPKVKKSLSGDALIDAHNESIAAACPQYTFITDAEEIAAFCAPKRK